MNIIILSIVIIVLSAFLTKIFCHKAINTQLMDKPNERSLHSVPTVRGGGLIFIGLPLLALPILCYFTNIQFSSQLLLFVCIFLLATVSFLDDLYNLSVKPRFLIHICVALLVTLFMRPIVLNFSLFSISSAVITIPFIFISCIWAINHFNFMDGLDGFCASQAIFLFASYGLFFSFAHAEFYVYLSCILTFSLAGFLIFNFPPARLFMGDVGSATLGFITFSLAVVAQEKYQIPIIYWFILNFLFLFDSTFTLIRRIKNNEKWSSPHRKHAYQRLKQFGINTRTILLGQAMINSIFLISVLLAHSQRVHLSILLILLTGLIFFIYYRIELLFPMFKKINFEA